MKFFHQTLIFYVQQLISQAHIYLQRKQLKIIYYKTHKTASTTVGTAETSPPVSATASGKWTTDAPQTSTSFGATTVTDHAFNSQANVLSSSSSSSVVEATPTDTAHAWTTEAAQTSAGRKIKVAGGNSTVPAGTGTGHVRTTLATITTKAKESSESATSTHVELINGQITGTVSDAYNSTASATATSTETGLLADLTLPVTAKARRTAILQA